MRSGKVVFVLLLCLVLLGNCGYVTIHFTPAANMNLAVEDIGPGSSLTWEEGKEALTSYTSEQSLERVLDSNSRTFRTADGNYVSTNIVAIDSVSEAKRWTPGWFDGLKVGAIKALAGEGIPDATPIDVDAPRLGDEARMVKVVNDVNGIYHYLLAFRKDNILVNIVAMARDDATALAMAQDFGAKLEAKIR